MKIFISYRRDDTRTVVGRIYDKLTPIFGDKNVFRDIDIIPPGTDFRDVLYTLILECDVMLVIIGDKWLSLENEYGRPRIEDPTDFVHMEVAKALDLYITVIPVLIPPARMPGEDALPIQISDLAYQNAWRIGEDPDFHRDMDGLINHLKIIETTIPVEYQAKNHKSKLTPPKSWQLVLRTLLVFVVSTVVALGVIAITYLQYESTSAPIQVEEQVIIEAPTNTIDNSSAYVLSTATASPTLEPTTPAPTNTTDPVIALAYSNINNNASWIPYSQEFNGIAMTLVPTGCFRMGGDEELLHTVCITQPYWIDRFEVSVEQFNTVGGQTANPTGWSENQPRTDINWFEAGAYCSQRGGRLPTEAEWEYAARGVDSLIFPWGNTFIYDFAHVPTYTGAPSPVGSRPGNVSWVGAFDMTGNVWEWTNTRADGYSYPYQIDGRENYTSSESIQHIIRGGSFNESNAGDEHFQRASKRTASPANYSSFNVGVRCVRDF